MTTGTRLDQTAPELRIWAEKQLDLAPEATAADVRADFVRRLPGDEFVPPWRRQQAFALLDRPGKESAEAVLRHGQLLTEEEDRLRDEVSAFTDVFFSLDCDERGRRWRTLRERCELHPSLTAWLGDLEAGLRVTVPALEDERTARLAEQIQTLFVLRRTVRAQRRRAILSEMLPLMTDWQRAAGHLVRECPAVAALEPVLMRQIVTWYEQFAKRALATAARLRATAAAESGGGANPNWAWVIAFIILAIIRVGISGSSSSSSRTPSYTPPPQIPRFDPEAFQRNHEEMERMRRLLEQLGTQPVDGTTPPGTRPRKWVLPNDLRVRPSTKKAPDTAPEREKPEEP